jgi:hypothetical protein
LGIEQSGFTIYVESKRVFEKVLVQTFELGGSQGDNGQMRALDLFKGSVAKFVNEDLLE